MYSKQGTVLVVPAGNPKDADTADENLNGASFSDLWPSNRFVWWSIQFENVASLTPHIFSSIYDLFNIWCWLLQMSYVFLHGFMSYFCWILQMSYLNFWILWFCSIHYMFSRLIIGIMIHSFCLATNRSMVHTVTIALMSKFIVFLTIISRKFNIVIVFCLFFLCFLLIGISVLCTVLISKLFDAYPDKQLCRLYPPFQGSTWNGRKGKGKGKQDWGHHCSKGHGAVGRARWYHVFFGTIGCRDHGIWFLGLNWRQPSAKKYIRNPGT